MSLPVMGQPAADRGILDLRNYKFNVQGTIQVTGEWGFYWKQLIDPSSPAETADSYINVPSAWKQLKSEIPGIEPVGYGSYNLKILLPANIENIALRFTEVFSSSGYYVNGKHVGFNGYPGTNKYQTVFGYLPTIYVLPVKSREIDLVVHVSNFEHKSGGIRGGLEIGTPLQIMEKSLRRQNRDFFLLGAFLVIGVYFMGLYLMRSTLYKLFFSLICMVMGFRILILSEAGFLSGDWVTCISRLRLEYLSFDLIVPLFVMMIRVVFPHDFPKLLFKVIIWTCSLMIIVVIVSPVSLFTAASIYYMYFVMFTAAVILYVIALAWIRGRAFAPGFAIGIAIVTVGVVNDMLFVLDVIETGHLSHITMFAYLLIYAMIFSGRTNKELKQNHQLSAEIKRVNENLEFIVEKRMRELNEKSEELIRHREELKQGNNVLQKEINIRNRFFTIMGHDIKGPVGYASQVLDLIMEGSMSREDEREMLSLLAQSSRATYNLVENLLYWGRSQTGELKSMPVVFPLDKIVLETTELFNLPLKNKKIKLEIDVEEEVSVFADKEHIRLVIRNLLSNAVKFTFEGGEIGICARDNLKTGKTLIEIKDTGTGIGQNEIRNIFTTRDVISATGTKNEKGSGIGLKLCKELMELNNGEITVESTVGSGTTFRISLPRHSML
ncbi:MAG: sensor histidine kinase [Bacteroidales bacterium]